MANSHPIVIPDWIRSGNTITFGCPKCQTPIKVYAGDVDEKGKLAHGVGCSSRQCDWKDSVRFEGYKPKK